MYGILCATPEELAALKATLHLDSEPQVRGPTIVWTGRHEDEPMVLALAGIGKVNAAIVIFVIYFSYFDFVWFPLRLLHGRIVCVSNKGKLTAIINIVFKFLPCYGGRSITSRY